MEIVVPQFLLLLQLAFARISTNKTMLLWTMTLPLLHHVFVVEKILGSQARLGNSTLCHGCEAFSLLYGGKEAWEDGDEAQCQKHDLQSFPRSQKR